MMKMKILSVITIIFSAIFLNSCAGNEEKEGTTYGDYAIKVESNEYYPATYTGKIVLSIENTKSGWDKLLHTSDDLKQDGQQYIVSDDYALDVQQKEEDVICRAYQESYKSKKQTIIVEYTDYTLSHSGEPLRIQIKGEKGMVEEEIFCPMTNIEESVMLSNTDESKKVAVSPTGFWIAEGAEEVKSFAVIYRDGEKEEFIDQETGIFQPTTGADAGVYYQEIGRWDEIDFIEYNGEQLMRI